VVMCRSTPRRRAQVSRQCSTPLGGGSETGTKQQSPWSNAEKLVGELHKMTTTKRAPAPPREQSTRHLGPLHRSKLVRRIHCHWSYQRKNCGIVFISFHLAGGVKQFDDRLEGRREVLLDAVRANGLNAGTQHKRRHCATRESRNLGKKHSVLVGGGPLRIQAEKAAAPIVSTPIWPRLRRRCRRCRI
jgi:hypothetical protein